MKITRRRFVRQISATTAAATCVASLPGLSEAAKEKDLSIVDTHQHLWDLKKFRLAWLSGVKELAQSYLVADYLKASQGLSVAKSIYMEVDVDVEQQTEEANYIIGLCKSGKAPTVAAVISGRPGSAGFKKYITQFKGSPYIKGVRQVLHPDAAPRGICLEKNYVRGIQLLGGMGMSFDLCMRPTELSDGLKLAKQCPDTRFIIDHCGNAKVAAFNPKTASEAPHNADDWRRDMAALAAQENTICKISGIVASAKKGAWSASDLAPIVNHCLDEFGPSRVVFGSDWPVCTLAATYRQWVTALKEIIAERPRKQQKKLLAKNAIRHYGLG